MNHTTKNQLTALLAFWADGFRMVGWSVLVLPGGILFGIPLLLGAVLLYLASLNKPVPPVVSIFTGQTGFIVIGLGVIGWIALALAVMAWLSQKIITQTLIPLQDGLVKLSEGDFSRRLRNPHRDEFCQIVTVFNNMAQYIEEEHNQSETRATALIGKLNQCREEQTVLKQIYNALRHHNQLLVQILGVGHMLQQNLNPASLFQEIVQTIHHSLGFEVVILSLVDEANVELRPRAYVGINNDQRQLFEESVYSWEDFSILLQDRYRIGHCYFFPHDGISPTLDQLESDRNGNGHLHNSSGAQWHPDDSLFVPIELRPGQVVGILSLGQPRDGQRPNADTLQALEVFAGQTAAAIENARLYEQVQRDLIERKRAAEELRLLNEQLEDRVKDRTLELAQTNKTLQVEIEERERAEERIMASLKEKEMLLKEIHHRVKNNLQVISSLLNLQAGYIESKEIRDIFRESQNRVRSMALVHEKLYRSEDLAQVDLAEYIRNLATFLFGSYQATAGRIALEIEAADVYLGIDAAVPCGLMLNELISNTLKHAFPNGRSGRILVELRLVENTEVTLIVADDGVGLPPDFDILESDSLGMQLVDTLVDQLEGVLDIESRNGTQFKITFPLVEQD